MYTAAVLDEASLDLLTSTFKKLFDAEAEGYEFQTQKGDKLPHHMTINMGPIDHILNPEFSVGDKVLLKIERFFVDPVLNVCAAEVFFAGITKIYASSRVDYSVNTVNDLESNKHVTLCIRPPKGKPFLSNKIDWRGAKPFDLESKSGFFKLPAQEGYLSLQAFIQECE